MSEMHLRSGRLRCQQRLLIKCTRFYRWKMCTRTHTHTHAHTHARTHAFFPCVHIACKSFSLSLSPALSLSLSPLLLSPSRRAKKAAARKFLRGLLCLGLQKFLLSGGTQSTNEDATKDEDELRQRCYYSTPYSQQERQTDRH